MLTCPNAEKPVRLRRRSLRTFFLFLLIPALMQFLTGCSFSAFPPEYPSQFSPLVSFNVNSDVCQDIAGHYSDKGEVFDSEGRSTGEASLSQLLHNNDPCFARADSVVVVGPEQIQLPRSGAQNVLEINSLKNGQPFAKWRNSMDYSTYCKKGFVRICNLESAGGTGYPGGIGWSNSDSLWLRHAVDGSLIVLRTEIAWGIIVFFPYHSERDLWYRFLPVGQSAPLN